ncbi:cobaltochelatase subunit CobN [Thermopetrobacter sp. TC1]|uniref:cobaltochelatase subunit CobN n=1 Tax=Thermopetrobacter sp. TC1 TaxID=1495045 RepID=UPI000571BCFD|nr:cobaltochelatase subunit CobN [Thermopetrobacter sp. TC1]
MHLLAATSGIVGDGEEAVDLAQDPADIIVISAADSELAALAAAHAALRKQAQDTGVSVPSLRLSSLLLLRHNMSVDLWLERTARHARLIVARILGGEAYWPYGVEELEALARAQGIALALLPGGHGVDEALMRRSSLDMPLCEAMRALLAAGGVENARRFLELAITIVRNGAEQAARALPAPCPLPSAGLWHEGRMHTSIPQGLCSDSRPKAPILFYRALLEGGLTAPVERLASALEAEGLCAMPLFLTSLKDEGARLFIQEALAELAPDVILNTTAFSAGADDPLSRADCPVLQVILSGSTRLAWQENPQGLAPRDLAMNVALPELDGRIITRACSFKRQNAFDEATQCALIRYEPDEERIRFVATLAARWVRLRRTPPEARRIALILANYPNRDSRMANGVGLDTPESTVRILRALKEAGYDIPHLPSDGTALIRWLQEGPTNAQPTPASPSDAILIVDDYMRYFNELSNDIKNSVLKRWGPPQNDPFCHDGAFHLPLRLNGKVALAIQPARGYNIDPAATYHDPALVPPHGYIAFYVWLREVFGAQAIVHVGKHGNLEWLPGKALALSPSCYPDAVFGPLPHLYPFIVNDPGEGAQAKRRTQAVIIDHLVPPLARAETYGRLAELERLMDEYWQASSLDSRRLDILRRDILDLAHVSGLDADAGVDNSTDEEEALVRLDAFLCEVKEAQIRNGLHILGDLVEGRALAEFLVALARLPRRDGRKGNAGLTQALAKDLGLNFDPLTCEPTAPWQGPRPEALQSLAEGPWRTHADTVERLEAAALRLIEHHVLGKETALPAALAHAALPETRAVLAWISTELLPRLQQGVSDEIGNLLKGLDGRFVPPGPSGAPSRGRPDVLPTGRNFYSLDPRGLPTPAAWRLGRASAENMLMRHFQETGEFPKAIGLSCWGTANMRTGGDDIAQALALIGVEPVWDHASGRVTGFAIIPLARLGRPRVDVTLRISGFFRDAFPEQIALFDRAIRAVGALDDEPEEDNPIAARMKAERERLRAAGFDAEQAERMAGYRIFGARPGAYGAGLQALFDEKLWQDLSDLAESYVNWGAYAYGSKEQGVRAEESFRRRLSALDAVAHNQDNREHDILDSDDYYQFEGGMAAAVKHLKGRAVPVWHNDHSRPEAPRTRSLEEEVSRVMRARVVNPKWIAAMRRHGYKGALELAATLDYMFAFAATTAAVKSHHFELAFDAWLRNEEVREWIAEVNPHALRDMVERFEEALARGFWRPRANDAAALLDTLRETARQNSTVKK